MRFWTMAWLKKICRQIQRTMDEKVLNITQFITLHQVVKHFIYQETIKQKKRDKH